MASAHQFITRSFVPSGSSKPWFYRCAGSLRAFAGTCYIAPRSSGTSPNLKHLGVAEISRRGIAVRVNEGADNSRYSFASSGGLPSAFGGDEPYRLHLYWNSIEHGEAMCLMIEPAAIGGPAAGIFARVIWQESRFNPTRRSETSRGQRAEGLLGIVRT